MLCDQGNDQRMLRTFASGVRPAGLCEHRLFVVCLRCDGGPAWTAENCSAQCKFWRRATAAACVEHEAVSITHHSGE